MTLTSKLNLTKVVTTNRDKQKHVDAIIDNFSQTLGLQLKGQHKENIEALCKLFVMPLKSTNTPVVADLGIGEGKSTLLIEFIKYMCSMDETFGAIIVKKTIQECKDFVIALGLKDKNDEEKFIKNSNNSAITHFEILKAEFEQNEDKFIGRAIRGFNFEECNMFQDKNEILKQGNHIGMPHNAITYSRNLCSRCDKAQCPVLQSQRKQKQHRIVVITHARLFLTNNKDSIFKDVLHWTDIEENKRDRSVIIIDEKIDTVDMGMFTKSDWGKIHSIGNNLDNETWIKEINTINNYFNSLDAQYPKANNVVPVIAYMPIFSFDEDLIQAISINSSDKHCISKLFSIEKFLKFGGTLGIHHKSKQKEIRYCRYLDIQNYLIPVSIKKCIVLDATSTLDNDYCKCNAITINDITKCKSGKINIYSTKVIASKTAIIEDYERNIELISMEIKGKLEALGSKTLIVVYKELSYYSDGKKSTHPFQKDISKKLKDLNVDLSSTHHLVHFGECTTGLNNFRDCKNIIVIGRLHKGTLYYPTKAKCLGLEASKVEQNEYLIEMIQQIGRTAIRNRQEVNVYFLGMPKVTVEEIGKYYNVTIGKWNLEHYGCNKPLHKRDETSSWKQIADFILSQLPNKNNKILKSNIKTYFIDEQGMDKHTYKKAIANEKLIEYLAKQGVAKTKPPKGNKLSDGYIRK